MFCFDLKKYPHSRGVESVSESVLESPGVVTTSQESESETEPIKLPRLRLRNVFFNLWYNFPLQMRIRMHFWKYSVQISSLISAGMHNALINRGRGSMNFKGDSKDTKHNHVPPPPNAPERGTRSTSGPKEFVRRAE